MGVTKLSEKELEYLRSQFVTLNKDNKNEKLVNLLLKN